MSQYQIRNRYKEVLGTFAEKEVLKQIAKGKFTGDEEVAIDPFDDWHKLASHPKFYDAFLKRLYQGGYASPEKTEVSSKPTKQKKESGGETRHQKKAKAKKAAGTAQHTRQVPEFGVTVHQSVIDELFSDQASRKKPPPEAAPFPLETPMAEPLADLEPEISPGQLARGSLDIADDVREEESPEAVKAKRDRQRRRRIVIGSVVALSLALLFHMGQANDGKPLIPDTSDPATALAEPTFQDENGKAAKVASLVSEGLDLYSMDGPLFYREADEVLKEALSFDEGNAEAMGRRAQAKARLLPFSDDRAADERDIARWLQMGRRADPQSPLFYQAEAMVALANDRLDEAAQQVLNAMESDPTNAETALLYGEVQYRKGDIASARSRLEDAIASPVSAVRAHLLLGRLWLEQKNPLKAKAEAFEALKQSPFHAELYLLLADTASSQNELREAKTFYETCGRLAKFGSPKTAARAYFRLASIEDLTGDKPGADRAYRLAYFYDRDVSPELGRKVATLDTSKKGLADLAKEAEFGDSYLDIQADNLLREGRLAEAIKFMQATQILAPRDGGAMVRLGTGLEKKAASLTDFQRISNIYERAIRRDPNLPDAYIRLGLLETDQYNFARGFQLLTRAQELAPEDAEPYIALGKHYYRRQDYNEALNQFLTAAKLNPSDSEVLYYAGLLRVAFKKDGAKDAMRFFYQAYTLNPQNYDALVEWLKLKVVNHEKPFAVKFIRNLIETDANNASLQWAYGEIYAANNEYYRSVTYFHKSLDFDNRSSKVRMSLARSLESVGELDKAVAEYRLASMLDPRNGDGNFQAAKILGQLKDFNRAETVLKTLITITPNYPGAHRELAQVFRARNQEKEATEAMEREVTNNPRNVKFRIELSEMYMGYKKYDKAITELAKVTNLPSVTKAPEYVYDKIRAFLLMSRSYRELSRLESAEGAIRLALELDSEDPELHRELGYVYHTMNRDKEAVKAFEYYLSRNPAAEDSVRIKGLINQMRIE